MNLLKNKKQLLHALGWILGIAGLYLALKDVDFSRLGQGIASMHPGYLIPIVAINFIVLFFKALRWQVFVNAACYISLKEIYRVLLWGNMLNSILPARLGEATMVYLVGKKTTLGSVSSTAVLFSERIIESLSFLVFITVLSFFTEAPPWLDQSILTVWMITCSFYVVALGFARWSPKSSFWGKVTRGVEGLKCWRASSKAFVYSIASWTFQLFMIYLIQIAVGLSLPLWAPLLVLVAVNIAITLPATPGHIGPFEYACVLAYKSAGVDESLGFLLGLLYHFLQILPLLGAGLVVFGFSQIVRRTPEPALAQNQ